MERNLILFLDHTEKHIIDRIKEAHPEWVAQDGVCKPCAQYYRSQLSGESSRSNIGPAGRRRRWVMGVALLAASFVLDFVLVAAGINRSARVFLFVPIFLGMLGLIQAREKTCALLAEFSLREAETGEEKINDPAVAGRLKRRGRKIFFQSALGALALTAFLFFWP